METQLSSSWKLTTEHPASSYGQPVLVRLADGEAFGPGDIVQAYPSWPMQPAAAAAERLARTADKLDDPLVQKFVRLAQVAG